MSFFNVKTDADAIKEDTGNGGKWIGSSGIYDVTILAPFVDTNDKGAMTVNFFVNANDQDQVIYGNLKLHNNDMSENFAAKIFNKLCIVTEIEPEDPVDGELPIGKKGAMKDVAILEDMADLEVKMRIQMEYSVHLGNIKEKTVIKGFYRNDGASAEEVVNETEIGVQLQKDLPYAENITYKDSLTAELITEWISGGRKKGTAGNSSIGTAKKKPSFGKSK